MPDESRQLVDRASRGDAVAIGELIEAHLPGLEAYVRANVGALVAGKESATDLVQSACREVLEHVDRFRYDGEDGFKRWLYATALRKMQDRHRYFKAEKRDAGRELGGAQESGAAGERLAQLLRDSATPSRAAARKDEFARVERVLATLPDHYRDVIRSAYLEGRPHKEIAELLGTTEANARMLLSRAIARLARLLEE